MPNRAVLLFTALETAALAVWLALTPTHPVLAIAVLALGLFLEHTVSLNNFMLMGTKAGLGKLFKLHGQESLEVAGFSITESLIWALWLALTVVNPVLAGAALLLLMWAQHNLELNTFLDLPILGKLFRGAAFGFTALETAAGIGWLALTQNGLPIPAVAVLFGGLLLEHMRQGKVLEQLDAPST